MSRKRRRGFRVVPVVVALGLLGVGGPPARAQAACPVTAADQAIDAEEHRFLELINEYRAANGRSALAGHPDVTRAAAWMSRDMVNRDVLAVDHVDSNGRYIDARISWCGAVYGAWAENIYAGNETAQAAFDWWRNSAPHNTNMLSTTITSIGIARAFGAGTQYGWYWTTDFTDSRRDPVANFDNDLDSEISVFRPSTSQWFVHGSAPVSFGASGDVPVPGDYDGDGDADIAVYRPANGGWFIQGQPTVFIGGAAGDIPVPADYDGDGDTDPAIFRPSVGGWYINGVAAPVFFGLPGDIPVPADYNGQGGVDIAVFRPAVGGWYRHNSSTVFHGLNGDIPVPANYDTDRDDDVAIFRPSVGGWYVSGGSTTFFGLNGDFPVPGNLDADVSADPAVFRRPAGGWYVSGGGTTFFGIPGDIPLLLPNHIQRFFTFAGG